MPEWSTLMLLGDTNNVVLSLYPFVFYPWSYKPWVFFYFLRVRLRSPWSHRKRKHALSPQQGHALFTSDGKLRDGRVKFLKKVHNNVSYLHSGWLWLLLLRCFNFVFHSCAHDINIGLFILFYWRVLIQVLEQMFGHSSWSISQLNPCFNSFNSILLSLEKYLSGSFSPYSGAYLIG